ITVLLDATSTPRLADLHDTSFTLTGAQRTTTAEDLLTALPAQPRDADGRTAPFGVPTANKVPRLGLVPGAALAFAVAPALAGSVSYIPDGPGEMRLWPGDFAFLGQVLEQTTPTGASPEEHESEAPPSSGPEQPPDPGTTEPHTPETLAQ